MSISAATSIINPLTVVLLVAVLGLSVICYTLYDKTLKQKKYAFLAEVMAKAGDSKPLGIIVDRSGKMIPFVCEHNPKNKGLLDNDNYTLVSPDLVKPDARSRFYKGPEVLFYPLPGYYPIGIQKSAALTQLAKRIRENSLLNWIPSEITVLSLLFNGTDTLLEDCRTVIESTVKYGNEIPEFFVTGELQDEEEDVEEDEGLQEEEIEVEEVEEEEGDFFAE